MTSIIIGRSRTFVFHLKGCLEKAVLTAESLSAKYLLLQQLDTEEELHGIACFAYLKSISAATALLPQADWEIVRDAPERVAAALREKNGYKLRESGIRPMTHVEKGQYGGARRKREHIEIACRDYISSSSSSSSRSSAAGGQVACDSGVVGSVPPLRLSDSAERRKAQLPSLGCAGAFPCAPPVSLRFEVSTTNDTGTEVDCDDDIVSAITTTTSASSASEPEADRPAKKRRRVSNNNDAATETTGTSPRALNYTWSMDSWTEVDLEALRALGRSGAVCHLSWQRDFAAPETGAPRLRGFVILRLKKTELGVRRLLMSGGSWWRLSRCAPCSSVEVLRFRHRPEEGAEYEEFSHSASGGSASGRRGVVGG